MSNYEVSEQIPAIFQIAKEAGTTTLLNTAPVASEIDQQFLELADIICPNEVNFTKP